LPAEPRALLDAVVRIEQFDGQAQAERVRDCFGIAEACWPVDQPGLPGWSLGAFTAKWAYGFDSNPRETWIGTDGSGEPVGCYLLALPARENVSMASVVVKVRPDARRAGAGRALLRHCAERARRAGRTRLEGSAWDASSGAAFAAAAGAIAGIPEVTRVLTLNDDVRGRLPGLRAEAEAHAADYSLLYWLGPTPDDLIGPVTRVHAAMADAPRDADVEHATWDADQIRRAEQLLASHGAVSYTVAARHRPTTDISAVTELLTDPGTPGWGFQQITAVRADHRGHRLGLLVKVAMLEWLGDAEPGIGRIITGNAGANEHMVAINARLGFEVAGVSRSWYVDLGGDRLE